MPTLQYSFFTALTLLALVFVECSGTDRVGISSYVNTTTGNFTGVVKSNTTVYKGIRYGDASIANRWKKATEIADTDLVTKAEEFGSICYQKISAKYPLSRMSEDCLFLNIWKPNDADKNHKKNVIVFIHGGAFVEGSSSDLLYNGLNLSEFDEGEVGASLVVSLNYRLGALGFLNIGRESGNYGLMDQKMAIEWIYQNIEQFGGDKNHITLMGQSAGAMSVGVHISNESDTSRYITNAIIQSPYMGMGFKDEKTSKEIALDIKAVLEKNSSNIYKMDPKDIITLSLSTTTSFEFNAKYLYKIDFKNLFPFSPYVDGKIVKKDLINSKTDIPLLIGNDKDESNFMFKSLTPKIVTKLIDYTNSKDGLHLPDPDIDAPLENFLTDVKFICPTNYFVKQEPQRMSTYFYHNEFLGSFNFWRDAKECEGKVCHTSEIPYIFGNWYQSNMTAVVPTENDKRFSVKIMKIWKEFSATSTIKGFRKYYENDSMIDINNKNPYFYLKKNILYDKCSKHKTSY